MRRSTSRTRSALPLQSRGGALARRELAGTAVVRARQGRLPTRALALREGRLSEAALRELPARPGIVIANAPGCDHPLRAGLALQLGAVLDRPSVGVTDRSWRWGAQPGPEHGAMACGG